MSDKMLLSPMRVGWRNSNSEIKAEIGEREALKIKCQVDLLTAQSIEDISAGDFSKGVKTEVKDLELIFPVFAEFRFKMLNFWEYKYNEFEILTVEDGLPDTADNQEIFKFWAKNSVHPNPGFYLVENTKWLEELDYGNIGSLGLNHYLLTGYDSYAEILAQGNFSSNI